MSGSQKKKPLVQCHKTEKSESKCLLSKVLGSEKKKNQDFVCPISLITPWTSKKCTTAFRKKFGNRAEKAVSSPHFWPGSDFLSKLTAFSRPDKYLWEKANTLLVDRYLALLSGTKPNFSMNSDRGTSFEKPLFHLTFFGEITAFLGLPEFNKIKNC